MKNLPFEFWTEEDFDNLNSYLRIAFLAIHIAGRPLHAGEILSIAERFHLIPNHLFGATQIKTLNARLSTHIRDFGKDSIFYRTAPAVYNLRSRNIEYDESKYVEFSKSLIREKKISSEEILVSKKDVISRKIQGFDTAISEQKWRNIFNKDCFFMQRREAETDLTVKQFVSYTTIRHNNHYLVHRRSRYGTPSDNLKDTLSIAIGGHVSALDHSLFGSGFDPFIENSVREINEELEIAKSNMSIRKLRDACRLIGFINVDDNSDARQHLAAVVLLDHDNDYTPKKRELGITDISWYDLENLRDERPLFDLWSGIIIDQILDGRYG